MLTKLLKYEIKATARTFLPIYTAILLVSIVNRLIRLTSSELIFNLTSIVLGGLFIALGVLTIIAIVQRFSKNLLSDEGYLMLTLPVTSSKLILSKLTTAVLWTVISGIIAILSFVILITDQSTILEFKEGIKELFLLLNHKLTAETITMIIQVPLLIIVAYIGFILTIYISLATAQLPVFNKYRGVMSFVAFFVITTVLQWMTMIIVQLFSPIFSDPGVIMFSVILVANTILDSILFIGTDFILKKHLNLE